MHLKTIALTLVFTLLGTRPAAAEANQTTPIPLKRTAGWEYRLSASLNGSLTYNHHVPGIDDGLSVTFGLALDGEVAFKWYEHRWETGLKLTSAWGKTATQKFLLKNADWAELYTRYVYRFRAWDHLFGLFAKLSLGASLFPGVLVYNEDKDLLYTLLDGTRIPDVAEKNQRLRITGAMTPLMLKQLLGASARPYDHPDAQLNLQLSFVGLEVWADGYTLDDDRSTPEKELRELQNYQQIGLQLDLTLSGELKKHLTYAFRAELMVPFVTSVSTPVKGFNLMNLDLGFKIGVKLSKWASLDYVFGAKRVPMLVSAWQLTTQLVLSIAINI